MAAPERGGTAREQVEQQLRLLGLVPAEHLGEVLLRQAKQSHLVGRPNIVYVGVTNARFFEGLT